MCLQEIGRHAQNLITILGLTIDVITGVTYTIIQPPKKIVHFDDE